MSWEEVASRLALALLLGIVVGLERQLRQNTAGLRMNSLVSLGAASFVLFGTSIAQNGVGTPDSLARISSQIITGIGFLGGGVIMREGASIKGIATAATLWCSAAIGMFAGAGFVTSALVCTTFIVATNLLLRPLAWSIKKRIDLPHAAHNTRQFTHTYAVHVSGAGTGQDHIRALLLQEINGSELHLQKLESKTDADSVEVIMTVTSSGAKHTLIEHMIGHLSLQHNVATVRWEEVANSA